MAKNEFMDVMLIGIVFGIRNEPYVSEIRLLTSPFAFTFWTI